MLPLFLFLKRELLNMGIVSGLEHIKMFRKHNGYKGNKVLDKDNFLKIKNAAHRLYKQLSHKYIVIPPLIEVALCLL